MICKGHSDGVSIHVCLTPESILFRSEFLPGPQKWRQPETQGDSFYFPILSPLNEKMMSVFLLLLLIPMLYDCKGKPPPHTSHLVLTTTQEVAEKQASRKLNDCPQDPQLTSSSAVTGMNTFRLREEQYSFLFTTVSWHEKRSGKARKEVH